MKLLPVLLVAILVSACGDTIVNVPTAPSTTPAPVEAKPSTIEYRVSGNANSVRIRYSNVSDGLSQVVTTMPYVTRFTTKDTTMFLSLEATPISYPFSVTFPFLSVQIFVDGNLFREASSNEFLLNTLSVSGTWRK